MIFVLIGIFNIFLWGEMIWLDFLERLLNEGIFICDSLFKLLLNEIVRRLCCLMFELIGVEVFLNIDLVLVFCEIVMVLLELLFFFW